MNDNHQDPFLEKAKQALDESADHLPPETQDKLNQIRREALNEADAKSRSAYWAWWAPGGGLAAAMLVAAVWLMNPDAPPPQPIDDMELLTSEEDMELMEDIEFVAWMMEQEMPEEMQQENAG